MEALIMTAACLAVVAAYVAWCHRKDRLADREHRAVITAMSPGPRVRELTTVRPNPLRTRKFAGGSQPAFSPASPGDFGHVSTDYGTYTPDAETPADPDTCATVDASFGGFDGGGHHGH